MENSNMVNRAIYLAIFFLFGISINAQKVSNILFKQEQSNIAITYDLEINTNCNISLYVSINGGETWQGPLKKVEGNIGDNVKSGNNKIIWRVLEEFEELSGNAIVFQIIAIKKDKSLNELESELKSLNALLLKNPKNSKLYKERGDLKIELRDNARKLKDETIDWKKLPSESSAINDYNKALLLNPKFAEAYKSRADIQKTLIDSINANNYKIILYDYNKAISLKPNYIDAFFERGKAKLELQDYEGAILDFNQVIKLDNIYKEVFYIRARCKYEKKDFIGANQDFKLHVENNKSKLENWRVGRFFYINEEYNLAIEYFSKAIEIQDQIDTKVYYSVFYDYDLNLDFTSYDDNLEYFYRGTSKFKLGDTNGAILDFYNYVEYSKNDTKKARANAKIAEFYFENNLLVKSLGYFNYAIKLDNKYYINRGWAKYKNVDYKGAIEDASHYIQYFPEDDNGYILRANSNKNLKNYSSAVEDYSKAINITPMLVLQYYDRISCNEELGNWRAVIEDYTILINKWNHDEFVSRGNAKWNLGDYKGAILDYSRAILINPKNGLAYLNRGHAKILIKDKIGACKDLNKAATLGEDEAYKLINENCN
jgi:tetratricopeptide (TPR) repeat protein